MVSPINRTGPSSPLGLALGAAAASADSPALPPTVMPATPVPTVRKNFRRFDFIAIAPNLIWSFHAGSTTDGDPCQGFQRASPRRWRYPRSISGGCDMRVGIRIGIGVCLVAFVAAAAK